MPAETVRPRWCFFYSSRRRHTRSKRDWSSDVCSSDLGGGAVIIAVLSLSFGFWADPASADDATVLWSAGALTLTEGTLLLGVSRSEERRVGKGGGARWAAERDRQRTAQKGVGRGTDGT